MTQTEALSRLNTEQIMARLADCPVGHTVDYHLSVPSTMPIAHALANRPTTRSGAVVIVEEQTAGRGRQQRGWTTPPESALLFSVILKGPLSIDPTQLPMAAGLAVVAALDSTFPALAGRVGLKWPNDVLLGDGMVNAQKVAGILIESEWRAGILAHAIVGIGLNVNQMQAELPPSQPGAPPPTSVRAFLQSDNALDRNTLFVALCRVLATTLSAGEGIVADWRSALWTLGQSVSILENGRIICQGRAEDVTPDGSLVLVDDAGVRRRFSAGDVSVRAQ